MDSRVGWCSCVLQHSHDSVRAGAAADTGRACLLREAWVEPGICHLRAVTADDLHGGIRVPVQSSHKHILGSSIRKAVRVFPISNHL